MACKKEGVPFSGTPEQEAALKKVITELKDTKGALMPIMQQAQDIYGYLPIEVQTMISNETGIPLERSTAFPHSIPSSHCSPRASIRFPYASALPAT